MTLGEIRITAPVIGLISDVLVKSNDKVLAGEPLSHLTDEEARARAATAEAQVALEDGRGAMNRRRAEPRHSAGPKMRWPEAEKAVFETRISADRVAVDQHTKNQEAAC